MSDVKERPILFSAPMVRALLDGRKTQTRRVVKVRTGDLCDVGACVAAVQEWVPAVDPIAGVVGRTSRVIRCPYGAPGDRLWVRETWAHISDVDDWRYRKRLREDGELYVYAEAFNAVRVRWRPSIHMPRRACRLTL